MKYSTSPNTSNSSASLAAAGPGYDATTTSQDLLAFLGRVLIAVMFIPAGWNKLIGFPNTVASIANKGIPLPEVCAAIAVGVELGLVLLLLVGWQARWAALGIAIFTLVITFLFHNFWAVAPEMMKAQRMSFDKNMAITGGLLAFAAFGAGAWSLDGRRRRE